MTPLSRSTRSGRFVISSVTLTSYLTVITDQCFEGDFLGEGDSRCRCRRSRVPIPRFVITVFRTAIIDTNTSNRLLRAYLPEDEIQSRILAFVPPRSCTSRLSTLYLPFVDGSRRSIPGTRYKNARRNWINHATHVLPIRNTHHKHPPRREVSVVARGATFSHAGFQLQCRRSRRRFSSPSRLS